MKKTFLTIVLVLMIFLLDSVNAQYSEEDYTNKWENEFRIDTKFGSYVSGSDFDFIGYYNNLFTKYTEPFATLPYSNTKEYLKNIPTWEKGVSWTVPSYNPGSMVYDLESIADMIVYQDASGYVFYNDTANPSGNPHGGDDTYAEEIQDAINALSQGDTTKIVLIKSSPNPYIIRDDIRPTQSNLILTGEGWGTEIKADVSFTDTEMITMNGYRNIVFKDFKINGTYPLRASDQFLECIKPINCENVTVLNCYITGGRKMGLVMHSSRYTYVVNNKFYDNCWNGGQPTRGHNSTFIGNWFKGWGDVAISTWSTDYCYFLNNIAFEGDWTIPSGYGGNTNSAGGMGFEGGGPNQLNSSNIYVRNNIFNNCTAVNGNIYGQSGIIYFGPEPSSGYFARDTIISNNTMRFSWRGVKAFPVDEKRNILYYDNFVEDNTDVQWWIRDDDHWVGRHHSSCTDGYVVFEINRQISSPNSPPERQCALEIVSETVNNLTFTIESLNHPYLADSSSVEVYHTGINEYWKIDFHNGTVVDAMSYYDPMTDIITLGIDWESSYFTISIYSTEPGTTSTSTTTTTSTTSTTTTTLPGQVSISGDLVDKDNQPVDADVTVYNQETNEINTSQITTDGNYNLGVWPDVYDLQFNILEFFIQNFWIKLMSFNVASNLIDVVNYVTGYSSENKVSFRVDIITDQEIQVFSEDEPVTVKVNEIEMTRESSKSELTPNEWFYNSTEKKLYLIASPVLPTTIPTTTTSSTTTTTTISGTTTTTLPQEGIQINDCDSLTDWTSRYAGQLSLNSSDYQEGSASISSVSASDYSWFRYDLSGTRDWSSYNTLTYWIKLNDVTEGFSLQIDTTSSDYWRWYFPKSGPSTANVWEEITVDLTNPDATVGSPTLSSIDRIRWINIRSTDNVWVDDIRVG